MQPSIVTAEHLRRLHHVCPPKFAQYLLAQKEVCLAGGAATYILCPFVPLDSVHDVDFFVSKLEVLWQLATELCKHLPDVKFSRQSATLRLESANLPKPIQFVLAVTDVDSLIAQFDLDMVQCALNQNVIHATPYFWQAKATRTIQHVLDFAYNPQRLAARFRKAAQKGFLPPEGVNRIRDLGVRLYRPPKVQDDTQWEWECGQSLLLKDPENYKPFRQATEHLTLADAKARPMAYFCRDEYEDDEEEKMGTSLAEMKLEEPEIEDLNMEGKLQLKDKQNKKWSYIEIKPHPRDPGLYWHVASVLDRDNQLFL